MVQDALDFRRAARVRGPGRGLAIAVLCLNALFLSSLAVRADTLSGAAGADPSARVETAATPPVTTPEPAAAPSDRDARCRIGAKEHAFHPFLPTARAEIRERGRLTIVALGSSSTEGVGASNPDSTYPALLKAELQARLPQVTVSVSNAGIGGQVAHDMWLRLDSDVIAKRPSLVIWQTGVNDAIRDVGEEKVAKIVKRGVDRMRKTGSDVVLMDLQWLPQPERYPRYAAYHAMLEDAAKANNVTLFPRYAMMENWAESGQFSNAELVGSDGLHMSDPSYRCLAVRLADGIIAALDGAKPPPLISSTPRQLARP